jgi:hypothetical protein
MQEAGQGLVDAALLQYSPPAQHSNSTVRFAITIAVSRQITTLDWLSRILPSVFSADKGPRRKDW